MEILQPLRVPVPVYTTRLLELAFPNKHQILMRGKIIGKLIAQAWALQAMSHCRRLKAVSKPWSHTEPLLVGRSWDRQPGMTNTRSDR